MAFTRGDRVHLPGAGSGTIRECRGGDRYAIEIKGRLFIAAGRDLEPAERTRVRAEREPRARSDDEEPAEGSVPSLDLHGRTAAETSELLVAFIDESLRAGHREARVIHGRSGGKVRAVVHAQLRELAAVRAFRLDPRNAGVTIVSF